MCNNGQETIGHIFRECGVARQLWQELGIPGFRSGLGQFIDWLEFVLSSCDLKKGGLIASCCWGISKGRNEKVWKHTQIGIDGLIHISKFIFLQWQENLNNKSYGTPHHHQSIDRYPRWTKPNSGCLKINTDAAIFQSMNCTSLAWIARDCWCLFQGAARRQLRGSLESKVVEALAIQEVLS